MESCVNLFDILVVVMPSAGVMLRLLCIQDISKGKSPLVTAQERVTKSSASTGLFANSNGEISGDTGRDWVKS